MAVGEVEHRLVLPCRDLLLREELPALLRREVAERQRAQQQLPAGVSVPGRAEWIPARQHDERVLAELWQKDIAQPGIQRRQHLEGVDQQYMATGPFRQDIKRMIGWTQSQDQATGGGESIRRRVDVACIEQK